MLECNLRELPGIHLVSARENQLSQMKFVKVCNWIPDQVINISSTILFNMSLKIPWAQQEKYNKYNLETDQVN